MPPFRMLAVLSRAAETEGATMIQLIRSADRYHIENEWLSAYWHFSFDHYHDPTNVSFGPLRVFNNDTDRPRRRLPFPPAPRDGNRHLSDQRAARAPRHHGQHRRHFPRRDPAHERRHGLAPLRVQSLGDRTHATRAALAVPGRAGAEAVVGTEGLSARRTRRQAAPHRRARRQHPRQAESGYPR